MRSVFQLQKYNDPELDDAAVDGLIKYFHLDTHVELARFLKFSNARDFAHDRLDAAFKTRRARKQLVEF